MKPRHSYTIILLSLYAAMSSCSSSAKLGNRPPQETSPAVEHEFLADAALTPAEEEEAESLNLLQEYVDEWLGTPHRMGGTTKKGVDCSGFVLCVYRDVYGSPFKSRRSRDIFRETLRIERADLEEGDLVFFKIESREVNHVGIYLGDGYFAHASLSSGLIISNLSEKYYKRYFYSGGRKN